MTEPKQWAIEQHIKKNPKCEWLCTHTKLENLGEQPEDRPTTEHTIDNLMKRLRPVLGMCDDDSCPSKCKQQLKGARKLIKAYVSDQVAKARIDERSQAQQYLHGLTITPESQHLFDVLSRDNHNRIATLNGVKNK